MTTTPEQDPVGTVRRWRSSYPAVAVKIGHGTWALILGGGTGRTVPSSHSTLTVCPVIGMVPGLGAAPVAGVSTEDRAVERSAP